MKRRMCAAAALCCALVLTACGMTPQTAARRVERDQAELTQIVQQVTQARSVDGVQYDGARRVVFVQDTGMVEFVCDAWGFASQTASSGFYYSPGGVPLGFDGADLALVPENGGWRWDEDGGDNWYYTERLCGNWFFYEMHF